MKTIVLDPGHGGSDPGATYKGNEEKKYNLLTALAVRDQLTAGYNVNVVMTRTGDSALSLSQRTDLANQKNADFYLSIHHNAGGGSGFESFVFNGAVPSQTLTNQKIIHDEVMASIKPAYSVIDRGKKRANFHVLRETKMSSLLLEILFIDDPKDLALMNNGDFRNRVVKGIVTGVAKALNLSKKSINGTLYKVIAGSFTEKTNAEDRMKALKGKGFDSFIDSVAISGKMYYRVQTGAFSDKENAENQVVDLKKIGIEAFIKVVGAQDPPPPPPPPKPPGVEYSISGPSELRADQLDAFVRTVNPNAPLLGAYYIRYGNIYGMRGDIAYAQAIHETNYFRFTGQVKPSQNNYAGIGTTGPGNDGATFKTPEEGVIAHIQHLYAYASTKPLPQGQTLVDPRFSLVKRGSATNWTDLNGKWAVPGTTYGQSILSVYSRNIEHALKGIENQKAMLNAVLKKLK
ncbi:N-acetylmuramoyl-L-alanine amidase [Rossellomorea sp. AcN35-11]|nr:N-acetylmuramoyl-L-alanine amidase [Rossellomorea aquimaris]WJV29655.1 N-acetylmuramoyl-L-alanine amidase [Rossellomorea sp. AcN35-11]